MVIGNGLIANIFTEYKNSDSVLIFASGVSNSMEISDDSYKREFDIIKTYEDIDMKFVYFSTTNINNDGKYFKHKKKVENYIIENFKNYLIFRLPNVVGFGGNNNNMFNFFKKSIINGDEIIVKNVLKSLIDIDDVLFICNNLMNYNNRIFNISYIELMNVLSIVEEMSKIFKTKPIIKLDLSKPHRDIIDNSDEVEVLIDERIDRNDYIKKIINKYGKH